MVQSKLKTLPDTPKTLKGNTQPHCMNEEVCGMMGDETVYGPAVVGGSQVVFKKGEKQLAKTK